MIGLIESLLLIFVILFVIYFIRSKPDEDPSIPYAKYASYPIIGHLIAFTRNRTKLLLECHRRYGACFRIRAANQRFIMIPSHADWMTIVKNSSFKFTGTELGIEIFGFSSVFLDHPELDPDTHRLYVQHLKNRDGLHPMVVEFVRRMYEAMRNDKVSLEKNHSASKWISTGLLELSHRMLFRPSTVALFGDIDTAALEQHFRLFDNKFHYFFIPFPKWVYSCFLRKELNARSSLGKSWQNKCDPNNASNFYRDRLAVYESHSDWLPKEEIGKLVTSFFWASLGNTIPAVFWSLFYILRDPKALQHIQQEMDVHLPFISLDEADSSTAYWTPEQIDSCIYLESAINETIRLVGAPFMLRKCCRDAQTSLEDGRQINI
ncbi:unnamed protein product, partial [Adineta ricciae]